MKGYRSQNGTKKEPRSCPDTKTTNHNGFSPTELCPLLLRRPGSPHSKQRKPFRAAFQSNSHRTSSRSTATRPLGSQFGKPSPSPQTPLLQQARFTPQQAAEAFPSRFSIKLPPNLVPEYRDPSPLVPNLGSPAPSPTTTAQARFTPQQAAEAFPSRFSIKLPPNLVPEYRDPLPPGSHLGSPPAPSPNPHYCAGQVHPTASSGSLSEPLFNQIPTAPQSKVLPCPLLRPIWERASFSSTPRRP